MLGKGRSIFLFGRSKFIRIIAICEFASGLNVFAELSGHLIVQFFWDVLSCVSELNGCQFPYAHLQLCAASVLGFLAFFVYDSSAYLKSNSILMSMHERCKHLKRIRRNSIANTLTVSK